MNAPDAPKMTDPAWMPPAKKEAAEITPQEFRDFLETVGWSRTEAAEKMNVHYRTLYNYDKGKRPIQGIVVSYIRVVLRLHASFDKDQFAALV